MQKIRVTEDAVEHGKDVSAWPRAMPDHETEVFHWYTSTWEDCNSLGIYKVSHALDFSKKKEKKNLN